jgi:hypothetical protein
MKLIICILMLLALVGCSDDTPSQSDSINVTVHPSSVNVPYGEALGFQLEINNPTASTVTVMVKGSYIKEGKTVIVPAWDAIALPTDPDSVFTVLHSSPTVVWDGVDDTIMVYTFKFLYDGKSVSVTINTPMQGAGIISG